MRHTLLAVTGMSPQVITESIYAFYKKGQPIDEVKVITTTRGKKEIWLNLMLGQDGQPPMLQQLINDYNLPSITFTQDNIFVIEDNQGNQLEDARTELEHQALADFITQKVQQETEKPEQTVHASIAGGRKTMTFLLGYAMSLYGRHQDTLSHVLVDEPFESSEFYYPTPYSKAIHTRFGRTEDAKDANVSLALIPFVRLRQELPESLLSGQASYTQAVEILNLAHEKYTLVVNIAERSLTINTNQLTLPPIEFAFYWWFLAQQQKQGQPITGPVKNAPDYEMATSFVDHYAEMTDYIVAEKLFTTVFEHDEFGQGMEMQYFAERKTRVNKAIESTFGHQIAKQIGIQKADRQKGKQRYAIHLSTQRVEVISS